MWHIYFVSCVDMSVRYKCELQFTRKGQVFPLCLVIVVSSYEKGVVEVLAC